MPDLCIPDLDACGRENPEQPGHWCCLDPAMHDPDFHVCSCGRWARDLSFELACALYVAFYSTRYRDETVTPPRAAVVAACRPADSPWRRLARVSTSMLGVTL